MDTDTASPASGSDGTSTVGVRFCALVTVFFAAVIAAFYLRSTHIQNCCDASSYMVLGLGMQEQGPFAKLVLSDIRTIGYPAFVAFASWLPIALGLKVKIVLLQSLLYWLAAMAVVRGSRGMLGTRTSRRALVVGLLGNPLAAMYCAESLTESLSLTLFLTMAAVLFSARKNPIELRRRFTIPFWVGLLAGVGLLVRPANLALVIGALLAMAMPPLLAELPLRRRLLHATRSIAVTAVGLYVALSPQIAVNLKLFNKATPFPTASLGELQMKEGLRHLKYATFVGTPKVQQVRYASPFARGTEIRPTDTFQWYLRNPGRGFLNVTGHVFAALDQDPLFTYVSDLSPWYRIPVAILNALVVVFGLGWLARMLGRHRREAARRPWVWFIVSSGVLSIGVVALAIPESRFGLLANSLCFAAASIAIARIIAEPRPLRVGWVVAGLTGSTVFALLALGMRGLASM
jgi:hypothetical protein